MRAVSITNANFFVERKNFFTQKRLISLLSIGIHGSASTDELWTGTSANNGGLTNLLFADSYGDSNSTEVHSDECKSNINTCISRDSFYCAGGVKLCPDTCCPRASCVGLRDYANLAKVIFFFALTLNYNCTVEVLTALCRKEYSSLSENGSNSRINSLCRLC